MNRKTILIAGLAVLLLAGFVACATESSRQVQTNRGTTQVQSNRGTTAEGFVWVRIVDVIITGYTGTATTVEIPSQIQGITVSEIENDAFMAGTWSGTGNNRKFVPGDRKITSLTIPDTITRIGAQAFRGNMLDNVVIPDSVTSIGFAAFYANQLTSITIPDSVTSIGDAAFRGNKLTSITIGTGVTSIGNRVFRENQLTSITIPDSVTSIGDSAFYDNRLTSITIGTGVTSIEKDAFYKNQLTSITVPNNVTSIGNSAFGDNRISSASANVPDSALHNNPIIAARAEQARIAEQQRRENNERLFERMAADGAAAEQAEQNRLAGIYRQAGNNTGGLVSTSWVGNKALTKELTRIDFGNGNYNWDRQTGTFRVQGDTIILLSNGKYEELTRIGNSINYQNKNYFGTTTETLYRRN